MEGCKIIHQVDNTVSTYAEHDEIYVIGEVDILLYPGDVVSKIEEHGFSWREDQTGWVYMT